MEEESDDAVLCERSKESRSPLQRREDSKLGIVRLGRDGLKSRPLLDSLDLLDQLRETDSKFGIQLEHEEEEGEGVLGEGEIFLEELSRVGDELPKVRSVNRGLGPAKGVVRARNSVCSV